MSRFMRGDSVQIMSGFPDASIDFILTDPPYLVGFKDRSGRSIAGDVNDEWVLPASRPDAQPPELRCRSGHFVTTHFYFADTAAAALLSTGFRPGYARRLWTTMNADLAARRFMPPCGGGGQKTRSVRSAAGAVPSL
ncbi:MAG: hypothetical protein G3W58_22675 [Pantoea ananatis]|nr:hypothetical protein [Pantoea ananatis]